MDEESFERWWRRFPRKDHKLAAIKAWKKLNPSPATIEKMMADIPRWEATDPQYVPHGSSYINGARWTDERSRIVEANSVVSDMANGGARPHRVGALEQLTMAREEKLRLTPAQLEANKRRLQQIIESIGK